MECFVEHVNHLQSPQLSQRDDLVCSDFLLQLIHHETTYASFYQPSIVLQRIGDDWQADQGEHSTIELDLQLHNLGFSTAGMRAEDRTK